MSESKVELTRITSNSNSFTGSSSPSAWQTPTVGDLNPTYHDVSTAAGVTNNHNQSVDPTSNDRMYDFVPGGAGANTGPPKPESTSISDKPAIPPDRRITTNALYEPSAGTVHPQTLQKGYAPNGEMEIDPDYGDDSSYNCARTVCLTIMVVLSLFLAVIAIVLVLLLWFGVIDPSTPECPTVAVTMMTTAPPTSDSVTDCSCDELNDIQPKIDEIALEAGNLSTQIELLSAQVENYASQSSNISAVTDSLDMSLDSVNSSCLSSLSNVTNQLGSFQGLNFTAQLSNFGVFNSCVYEYINECLMPQDTFDCQTNYTSAIVPGYFNLDLACHVGISQSSGAVLFAPVTNLRFNSSITVNSDTSAQAVLDNSMVRCECSLIAISSSDMRNEQFHCKMYRARCLSIETFQTTVTAA